MKHNMTRLLSLTLISMLALSPLQASEKSLLGHKGQVSENSKSVNLQRAKETIESAADRAAKSILLDTRLDIDIRLIGRTSIKIAAER